MEAMMLATATKKVEHKKVIEHYKETHVAEIKFDGTRMLTEKKNGNIQLFGRSGNSYTNKFPEFAEDLALLPDCVLDGELIYRGGTSDTFPIVSGRCNSTERMRISLGAAQTPLDYMVFDILEIEGRNLRGLPLSERKKELDTLFAMYPFIHYRKVRSDVDPCELYEFIVSNNSYEGLVLKKKASRYIGSRTKDWLKLKNTEEEVVFATGYEVTNAGIVITFDGHRVTCNGKQSDKVKSIIDTTGKCKCEISFLNKTDDGNYRMPTFKRVFGAE